MGPTWTYAATIQLHGTWISSSVVHSLLEFKGRMGPREKCRWHKFEVVVGFKIYKHMGGLHVIYVVYMANMATWPMCLHQEWYNADNMALSMEQHSIFPTRLLKWHGVEAPPRDHHSP